MSKPLLPVNTYGVDLAGQALVEDWNKNYHAGTHVLLTNDDVQVEHTETRSEAWLLGSGTPVVKVKGRAGGYL